MERDGGFYIIMGNALFTLIAATALLVGGWPGVAALTVCAIYFTVSTAALIMAATGGLRDVLIVALERTAYLFELSMLIRYRRSRVQVRDAGEIFEMPEMPTDEGMVLSGKTFVSPLESRQDAIRRQADAWLASLMLPDGRIDSHKVHTISASGNEGWLKVRAPVGDVRADLLRRGLLEQRANGYAVNLERVTRRDVYI